MDLGKMVDVAIGLSLMYLVLSLFCTIINEYISSLFSIRSATLKSQLLKIAGNRPEFVAILAHPSIRSACIDVNKLSVPAELAADSKNKAQAELDAAKQAVADSTLADALPGLNAAVQRAQDLLAQAVAVENRVSEAKSSQNQTDQSYISGRAFASAMLDTINPNIQMSDTATYKAVMNGIGNLPDGHLKEVLRSTVNNATADIQSVRDAIAHWFDGEMERVQGAYKRIVQRVALGVGLGLAVILNADTLQVSKVLWQDHALAAKVALGASQLLEGDRGTVVKGLVDADQAVVDAMKAKDGASRDKAAAQAELDALGGNATDEARKRLEAATTKLADAESGLETAMKSRETQIKTAQGNISAFKDALAPLPIGWGEGEFDRWREGLVARESVDGPDAPNRRKESWLRLCGMIFTALALAMGAPFWFDTLNRFINIRSAGAKPATTAELLRAEKGAS